MSKLIRNKKRRTPLIYIRVRDISLQDANKYIGKYIYAWNNNTEDKKVIEGKFTEVKPVVILRITGIINHGKHFSLKAIYGELTYVEESTNNRYIDYVNIGHYSNNWFVTNDVKHIGKTARRYKLHKYSGFKEA